MRNGAGGMGTGAREEQGLEVSGPELGAGCFGRKLLDIWGGAKRELAVGAWDTEGRSGMERGF